MKTCYIHVIWAKSISPDFSLSLSRKHGDQYHTDEVSSPIKAEPTARWWIQELLQAIEKDICSGDSGITFILLPTSPPAPWAGPEAILTSPKPKGSLL